MGTLFFFLAIIVIAFATSSIKIVRPWEKGLVETLGKYQKTVSSGLTVLFPVTQHIMKVDMREQVVDVPPQSVITKDNVVVEVDAVIYYEVTDPVKVVYNVANFFAAATKLAQTNLRNLIGDMLLDEALTSREMINTKLKEVLDIATDKWGTRVTRVELQRIDPPKDVTDSMHKQMKAEREKRAAILEAEGAKQSAILKAEGQAEAIKKIADADKYQKIANAQGEAEATMNVFNAIHSGKPTNDLLAIKYMEMLGKVADGKATKVFLPLETSGFLGSIAGIKELFSDKKEDKEEK